MGKHKMIAKSCPKCELQVKGKPLTKEEIISLLDLIEDSKVITLKTTNASNNKIKNDAWIRLTKRFNAIATNRPRNPRQLRLKWENLKKNARRRSTKIRMNQMKIGSPDYIPPDSILDRVTRLDRPRPRGKVSGCTVTSGGDKDKEVGFVDCGGSDSDASNIEDTESVVETSEPLNPMPLSNDNCIEDAVTEQESDRINQNRVTPNETKKCIFHSPRTGVGRSYRTELAELLAYLLYCGLHIKVAVASKSCKCGHTFFASRRGADCLPAVEDIKRRTGRVRRSQPQFYDAQHYQKQIKRRSPKKRSLSRSMDEDAKPKDKNESDRTGRMGRGGATSAPDVAPRARRRRALRRAQRPPPGNSSGERTRDPTPQLRPPQLARCNLILQEINRKISSVQWQPPADM